MNHNELDTEQIIREAGEVEFLEKGYGNSKMMAIAKRANVSHSMLHYYYRNKENLFQTIFKEKIQMVSLSFEEIFDKRLPFFETVRLIVESQFDFAAKNPKLPLFILNEILSNKENRALVFNSLSPKVKSIINKLNTMFNEEIAKGTIRPISLSDFLMNMVSMNLTVFILLPIIEEFPSVNIEKLLRERRESNIQFILNALRP
jgi:AcrR family transcriptional regulator